MDNDALKTLCLSLMKADSEEDVVSLLSQAGHWDNLDAWRCLGDRPNNFSISGNQQSRSDAALVEKLVNSVDARLMGECRRVGLDPESQNEAPPNIRYAVAKFIEKNPAPEKEYTGRVSGWTDKQRTDIARDITLAATGARSQPSLTISDAGEGQTPERVPHTIMSLTENNKLNIPFVQGKFNMGGTGALRFCGDKNLQLVVTRRDPDILNAQNTEKSDNMWSFTVVRRDEPRGGERSSVYRYLAPVDCKQKQEKGGVLRFESEAMPIFPERNEPYVRESTYGTLIKLYEYQLKGRSHILLSDGLLYKVDLLLPDPALPIRFHECRDYEGGSASFDTTLTGLSVRLSDGKAHSMEPEFPVSCPFVVEGQKLVATIYAFKKGKAGTYRKKEGVIFVINGQTHATQGIDFFRSRKKVGLGYIADSLLVKIDCSNMEPRIREDLFMNSRDRLSDDSKMKSGISKVLSQMLKQHEGLRELNNRRREEEIAERLADNKPLADTLESIIKQSPALSSLFLAGVKIKNPFKTKSAGVKAKPYVGERYPTYFHFRKKKAGEDIKRGCHINAQCKIAFDTDAENEYFSREDEPGWADVQIDRDGHKIPLENYFGPYPNNGRATLRFDLPKGVQIGDQLRVIITVSDSREHLFENVCLLSVQPPVKKDYPNPNPPSPPPPPPDPDSGDEQMPSGIALPEIIPVTEEKWEKQEPPFNKFTALRIKSASVAEIEEGAEVYDFYINEDNLFLKSELKNADDKEKLVKSQFRYGMVLIGLALIHDQKQANQTEISAGEADGEGAPVEIEEQVENISKALAPFMVPMIVALGALEVDDEPSEGAVD